MNDLPKENIYGHINRVNWFKNYIKKTDRILEVGCGTGYMITYPLRMEGYNIEGIDLDSASIEYGRRNFQKNTPDYLFCMNIKDIDFTNYDVIIISEVLEHLTDNEVTDILHEIHSRLRPSGMLLATVPNGYGWFECEKILWDKTGLGYILKKIKLSSLIFKLMSFIYNYTATRHPSTLSTSPHIQRFTLKRISRIIENAGFSIACNRGSTLCAGPVSDLFLTGNKTIMALNVKVGEKLPKFSSGFYIAARRKDFQEL
jgi:2-polyprenyl-3-methyl-5-hydroxy-6-metoxy-1,4-benzoquinol methylase